jgi:hypothetical protein
VEVNEIFNFLSVSTPRSRVHIIYRCIANYNLYFQRSVVNIITFFSFLVALTLGSLLPLLEHRAEFPQFLDQGQSV